MKKKSLGINALLNGLRSALNLIFPLITFPYVARVLSVEGIGIYNFSNIYVNYFVLLAGLGIATYAVREGAKYRDDKRKISTFSSEIFSINIISTIIAYLLLIISLIVFKNLHNYVSTILIFSLQILFTTIGTEWIYTIYEDYSYITVRSIIFKVFSIILLFIFVRKPNDYVWYAGITVFSSVGSNILNFVHARSFIEIHFVKSINVKRHLKPILIIFASTVAVTLYVSSDTTILGLLKNDYAVGIYSVAVKIYTLTNGLLGGLLIVTVPRLAMLLGNKRMKDYTILLSQVINMITILIFPIATGLIMLSKEVILIIAGEKYLNSIFSLQIIAMALGFSIFSSIFDQCVLIPAKRERFVLRNTLITGVANVLLNFIMIPLISYDGAALTTVMSEAIVMSLNLRSARDIVGPIIFSKDNVKNVFSSLIGCLGIVLVCSLGKLEMHSLILYIIVSVILSIIVYGIILIFCGNEIALFYLKKIKNRKNKLL